jgi:pilus assembly protein CpaE
VCKETYVVSTNIEANDGLGDGPAEPGQRLSAVPSAPGGGARARVVIGIKDLAFHQEVQDFVVRDSRVDVVGAVFTADRLVPLLVSNAPDACVVCPVVGRELRHPSLGTARPALVIVAQEMTVPVLRDALDAAASAVLAWPEERAELSRLIVGAARSRSTSQSHGRVFAVTGARGGAGATFVATHLAQAFADAGSSTVLVDADRSFADVTAALGVGPNAEVRTIADLIPVAEELSPQHVTDALFRHPRGFSVLLGPPEPGQADLRPGLYRGVVALLAGEFEVVVVHVPRVLDEVARAALELADEVALVTTLDLMGLQGARRILNAIVEGGALPSTRLVVNRIVRSSVSAKDVERVLRVPPAAAISPDDRVRRARERGELLMPKARGAARDLRRLTRLLSERSAT